MQITGKVILITGASSGIGKAAAELLDKEGAKLALAARSEQALEDMAKGFSDAYVVKTDMTEKSDIRKMVEKTQKHFGHIDVLINNAGRGLMGSIEKLKVDDFEDNITLNVVGPLVAMQEVIPIMKAQKKGLIINISSALSKMAVPYLGGYAATKYALNALSFTARNELKEAGVKVTALYPGLTDTNFGKNSVQSTDEAWTANRGMPQADTPEMVAEKIKEAILAEPAEQYMNDGQKAFLSKELPSA